MPVLAAGRVLLAAKFVAFFGLLLFGANPCIFLYLLSMAFNQQSSRLAFQRLSRQLDKLAVRRAPESVHKFRTYGRRVEAVLDALVPQLTRNDKKLLKLMAQLRKKAGRVRDLDVQLSILRNLKIPQEARRKSQLLQSLAEERGLREKRLAQAFDKDVLRDLRRRLKRASKDEIPASTDPLGVALKLLSDLSLERAPLTEKTLHRYRVVGKRARYLAELAGDDPAAKHAVEVLKRMQDVIGDWHDWLKLTMKAEDQFGGAQDSPVVAVLRNVTQAKFRRAVDALVETRAALALRKQAPAPSTASRKSSARAAKSAAA